MVDKEKYSLFQRIGIEKMTGEDLNREARSAPVEELFELGNYAMSWIKNPNKNSELGNFFMFIVVKELAIRDIEPPWPEVYNQWRELKESLKDSF